MTIQLIGPDILTNDIFICIFFMKAFAFWSKIHCNAFLWVQMEISERRLR